VSEADNLELKKKARRRLVGAAALALFAAIVLPMVMDEEPGSLQSHDIQVTIPERSAALPLAPPVDGHPVEPAEEAAAPPISVVEPAATVVTPRIESVTPPSQPSRERETVVSPPAVPAARPAAVPPSTPAVQPKPAGAREEERVRRILEGEMTASVQRYFVQVGAFGDRAKAVTLSNSLVAQGFRAYSEQAGAVTRVRIGPFQDRREAERTIAKLKDLGMDGVIASR